MDRSAAYADVGIKRRPNKASYERHAIRRLLIVRDIIPIDHESELAEQKTVRTCTKRRFSGYSVVARKCRVSVPLAVHSPTPILPTPRPPEPEGAAGHAIPFDTRMMTVDPVATSVPASGMVAVTLPLDTLSLQPVVTLETSPAPLTADTQAA